jgi:biotin carboxyl carrier protein
VAHHEADAPERTPEERQADHAAIDRLADELLPALVAKLGASGLGELDVREGSWRVRLRMPGDGRAARRAAGPGRASARLESHAATAVHPATASGGPGATASGGAATATSSAGTAAAAAASDRATGGADPDLVSPAPDAALTRAVATSPAVGFFRPRPELAVGARVRAGDRIGSIDVLGVPHELVAPADGMVGATIVEPGDPVEYGQPLVEIELLDEPGAALGDPAGGRADEPGATAPGAGAGHGAAAPAGGPDRTEAG